MEWTTEQGVNVNEKQEGRNQFTDFSSDILLFCGNDVGLFLFPNRCT